MVLNNSILKDKRDSNVIFDSNDFFAGGVYYAPTPINTHIKVTIFSSFNLIIFKRNCGPTVNTQESELATS